MHPVCKGHVNAYALKETPNSNSTESIRHRNANATRTQRERYHKRVTQFYVPPGGRFNRATLPVRVSE